MTRSVLEGANQFHPVEVTALARSNAKQVGPVLFAVTTLLP
jgi:hypothetical protein